MCVKIVKEQENKISTDKTQLVNNYKLHKQGRDLLTQLKPLK